MIEASTLHKASSVANAVDSKYFRYTSIHDVGGNDQSGKRASVPPLTVFDYRC